MKATIAGGILGGAGTWAVLTFGWPPWPWLVVGALGVAVVFLLWVLFVMISAARGSIGRGLGW